MLHCPVRFWFMAFTVLGLCVDLPGAARESSLLKRVAPCRIEQAGAYNALGEISARSGVAIGVDAVQPNEEPSVAFDFPGGTVSDLLSLFATQAPGYTWQEGPDGVVHVRRTGAHVSLLDVVMAYPGVRNQTRKEIWEDIAERPEISAWMNSGRCSRAEFFHGEEFRANNGPISIAAGNLTLEQLLDVVATKSGTNYWAVLQSPPSAGPCRVAIILW